MAKPRTSPRKFKTILEQEQELAELCAWIDAHLHTDIGWQELMAQSHLDHQTINALFFRFQSTTPMTWIRRRRELRNAQLGRAVPRQLPRALAK